MELDDYSQICLNGHLINGSVKERPHLTKTHCRYCGEMTITFCQHCSTPLERHSLWLQEGRFVSEKFCSECGEAYPWIKRREFAAKELITNSTNLTGEAINDFKESISGLIYENVNTDPSVFKFILYTKSLENELQNRLKAILLPIVVDRIKTSLWKSK